jgi:hypothetical protein
MQAWPTSGSDSPSSVSSSASSSSSSSSSSSTSLSASFTIPSPLELEFLIAPSRVDALRQLQPASGLFAYASALSSPLFFFPTTKDCCSLSLTLKPAAAKLFDLDGSTECNIFFGQCQSCKLWHYPSFEEQRPDNGPHKRKYSNPSSLDHFMPTDASVLTLRYLRHLDSLM